MKIELTTEEACTLYDMIYRWNETEQPSIKNAAEQQLIWDLECILEKELELIEIRQEERKKLHSPCRKQEKGAVPMDQVQFQEFIDASCIFEKTRVHMYEYLKNWYEDDAKHFIEEMRADLDTVLSTYHFYNNNVSICKDLERETDYINCWIRITDEEDDLCCDYRTMYDYALVAFDDTMEM